MTSACASAPVMRGSRCRPPGAETTGPLFPAGYLQGKYLPQRAEAQAALEVPALSRGFRRLRSPYDSFGEYGFQVLCALQFALSIHHCVGRSYQLRDDAAAAGDRIALIAPRLEEVRGRHAFARCERHGDHIEAIAVAGEVHHLQLGRTQDRAISLCARKYDGVQELLRLQQRTNVQIQIQRMDAETFGRVRQLVVR